MARRPKPLSELRHQREWTFAEFSRILGASRNYAASRATLPDERGEGVIRLPIGDVPYITDQFHGTATRPRRLVLACDYEAVEAARTSSAGQPHAASPSPGLAGNPTPDLAGTQGQHETPAELAGTSPGSHQRKDIP